MNNAKKISAVVLAAAMAASCSGCADQSWSYRSGDASISAGTYIYNLLNGYYEGYDLVESPDEVKDVLAVEVTGSDEDAQTKTVEQYAYDEADKASKKMIAVESLFNSYGLTLNDTEDNAARSYASQVWTTAKKTLEGYGISEESFNYCYADYTVKYGQVFEHLYGEEGEQYVKNEDLKAYFDDNFIGYAYFSESMADTNEDGESVAKSDADFKKAETSFNKYADMINKDGKDYKTVVKQYIKDYDETSDPTLSGSIEIDGTTAIDTAVVEKLKALDEGKAAVVKTGEDASTLYYLVYRPKSSEIEDYYDDDTSNSPAASSDEVYIYDLKSGYTRYSLLNKMKGDDYSDYLVSYADQINVEKNEAALKKYKPKMFIMDKEVES